MRAGQAERLLGVVGEVGLRILVGKVSDDLDRGLVGTNGTIAAKTVEHARGGAFGFRCDDLVNRQRRIGDVVVDTDGESVEAALFEVLEDSEDHGRREVLGGQAVATTDDSNCGIVQSDLDVHVEGFADRARFLGAV